MLPVGGDGSHVALVGWRRTTGKVHPGGHPISHSVKAGLRQSRCELGLYCKHAGPPFEVKASRWERAQSVAASFRGREFLSRVSCDASPDFQSRALAVGQRLAANLSAAVCRPSPLVGARPARLSFPWTVAVGQRFSLPQSHAVPANVSPCPLPWLGPPLEPSEPLAVGQQEDSGALVWGANVTRTNDGPDATVAPGIKVLADEGNSGSCSGDVLPEEERGFALDGDPDVLKEELGPAAIQPSAFPGEAEILARRAASDEIHQSTPRASVEGAHVVPDRSRCQPRFFHPGHEDGCGEGFPLEVHHRLHSTGEGEAEIEPSDSGADADRSDGGRGATLSPPK